MAVPRATYRRAAPVLVEGVLFRMSSSVLKSADSRRVTPSAADVWKRRFYQVRDGLLLQFRTRDVAREKPTGWFKLADIHAQAADPTVPVFGVAPEDRACVIELRSAKRLVLLRAPTHEEATAWLSVLRATGSSGESIPTVGSHTPRLVPTVPSPHVSPTAEDAARTPLRAGSPTHARAHPVTQHGSSALPALHHGDSASASLPRASVGVGRRMLGASQRSSGSAISAMSATTSATSASADSGASGAPSTGSDTVGCDESKLQARSELRGHGLKRGPHERRGNRRRHKRSGRGASHGHGHGHKRQHSDHSSSSSHPRRARTGASDRRLSIERTWSLDEFSAVGGAVPNQSSPRSHDASAHAQPPRPVPRVDTGLSGVSLPSISSAAGTGDDVGSAPQQRPPSRHAASRRVRVGTSLLDGPGVSSRRVSGHSGRGHSDDSHRDHAHPTAHARSRHGSGSVPALHVMTNASDSAPPSPDACTAGAALPKTPPRRHRTMSAAAAACNATVEPAPGVDDAVHGGAGSRSSSRADDRDDGASAREDGMHSALDDHRPTSALRLWKSRSLVELMRVARQRGDHSVNLEHIRMSDLALHESLGVGTGGRAYRAVLRGKQVVVAKRLHSGDVVDARELLAHARAGHHPHVVTLLGVAVDTPMEHEAGGTGVPAASWGGKQGHDGVCSTYIVMEHVERGSLAQVLAKHGPVTRMRHLMKWAWQLADGVAHLHQLRICHRDLAARNVLVSRKGALKVADFGFSRTLHRTGTQKTLSRKGPIAYMPPEALQDAKYQTKSDTWMYGCVVYEMLTGRAPWHEFTVLEVVQRVVLKRETLDSHLPENIYLPLRRLLRDCWLYDYHARPSMEEVKVLLEEMCKALFGCGNPSRLPVTCGRNSPASSPHLHPDPYRAMLLASAGSDRSSSLHLSSSALSTSNKTTPAGHPTGAIRLGPPPRATSRERTASAGIAGSVNATALRAKVSDAQPSPSSPLRHAAAAEVVDDDVNGSDTMLGDVRGRSISGDGSLTSPPLLAPTPPSTTPPEHDVNADTNVGRYTEPDAIFGDHDAAEVLEESTLAALGGAGRPLTAMTATHESCSLPSSRYDDF